MPSAPKPPGLVTILISAFFSLFLGVLLAVVALVFKPVEVVKSQPKEPIQGTIYYVPGETGRAGAKTWATKGAAMVAGEAGTYLLSEADLNGWASARFEQAAAPEGTPLALVAGVPNFRLNGDELQAGAQNKLVWMGGELPLVLQVAGGFEQSGTGGWAFVPKSGYLGSFPLHKAPGAMAAVLRALSGAGEGAEEAVKVLSNAKTVAIVANNLVVAMP